MEDIKITEQESLDIIQKMIDKTRQGMFNGKPLLWFGYVLAIGIIVFNLLAFYVNEAWAENLVIFYLITLGVVLSLLPYLWKTGERNLMSVVIPIE